MLQYSNTLFSILNPKRTTIQKHKSQPKCNLTKERLKIETPIYEMLVEAIEQEAV